ncbi:hypothetical protein ACFFK0_12365 [Paenibacillus chartarius]|uniref:Uncharacterized protein n=1 Tax=Paenibacillus chartarius TaxID=747481 RepID=A0ABV6DKP9_9BACL
MRENEDAYGDDQMAVGRGVVFGVIFGTVLWGIIIAAVAFFLK